MSVGDDTGKFLGATHVDADPRDHLSAEGKIRRGVPAARSASERIFAEACKYYGSPPWDREQIIAAMTVAVEEAH